MPTNNSSKIPVKNSVVPGLIYGLFTILFLTWVLKTYRSELHMDVMYIVNTKIRHLYEGNLHPTDFIYHPLFPGFTSMCFIFLNAKLFHLNTVIEAVAGSVFLIILGYRYLRGFDKFLSTPLQKILFAAMTAFIIFGLHKWEALFTPCFSFAVFFDLCICFFSYFFILNYLKPSCSTKTSNVLLYFFFNLLVISEGPAYYLSFVLAVIILLLLIKRFRTMEYDNNKWLNLAILNFCLLLMSIMVIVILSKSNHPAFKQFSATEGSGSIFQAILDKPIWLFKFYVLANTGPFLGEASNFLEWRMIFGMGILILYVLAIKYAIKRKEGKLMIPVAMIISTLISFGFITLSRNSYGAIEYGSSSRYTAYNMSGVLGLATILFFYIREEIEKRKRIAGWVILGIILAGYITVDVRQLEISPYRTQSFKEIRNALLFAKNLEILQADTAVSKAAISVLKKYHLNVYEGTSDAITRHNLGTQGKINIVAGSPAFEEIRKIGFNGYEPDNKFAWTNGNAFFSFDKLPQTEDSLVIRMETYMPEICKNIVPRIIAVDENNNQVEVPLEKREENIFIYSISFKKLTSIQELNIVSDKIEAAGDQRTLSFPFKGIEIGNHR